MSRKRKHNIPLLLAVILLILTLLSLRLTGGLFARYRAMSASSDSARVAKFDVDVSVEPHGNGTVSNAINSDDTDDTDGTEGTKKYAAEYVLTVTNNSEVAVSYEIVVNFGEAIDFDKMAVTIEGATIEVSEDQKSVKFSNAGWTLEPNAETTATHNLVFKLTDWTFVTGGAEGTEEATKNLSFTVNVTATQID